MMAVFDDDLTFYLRFFTKYLRLYTSRFFSFRGASL